MKATLHLDYELARVLGVSTERISNYRTGRNLPNNWMAARVARELGIDRIKVIADIRNERAKRSKQRLAPARVK